MSEGGGHSREMKRVKRAEKVKNRDNGKKGPKLEENEAENVWE